MANDLPLGGDTDIPSAPKPVRFDAADGFPLCGDLFSGNGDGPLVLISAATGAPRTFYNKFAAWLVENGAKAAFTYDYRAMPGSPKPADWKGRISFKDWALFDFPAAALHLSGRFPGHAMVGIGQSFGGQALGLSGVADRFARYAFVATLSGHFGYLSEPLKSFILMNVVGLPVTLVLGRTARWMGLGGHVPGSVYRDWAKWCRHPDYFFGDRTLVETDRFDAVTTPILSIGMTDDPWGTPKAVHEFVKHYRAAELTQIWVSPDDSNGQPIGHLGFFRSRHRDTLWPIAGGWLLNGKLPERR
ncbi:MAG: hypothetical protein R3D45_06840 [Rhizobiaceae bacterium]